MNFVDAYVSCLRPRTTSAGQFRGSEHRGPPRGFWEQGKRALIAGEQGNEGQILRGTGEQTQYWGTANIRKHIFDLGGGGDSGTIQFISGEQGNKYPLCGPQHNQP